ncbi:MAG: hypothetical protein AVDCRST_MAG05-3920, partial [uncultured Rubrobacteraceae bacterium]
WRPPWTCEPCRRPLPTSGPQRWPGRRCCTSRSTTWRARTCRCSSPGRTG